MRPGGRREKRGDWFFVDEDDLLSVDEITRILKVSRPTVQRWCRARKLPAAAEGKTWIDGTRVNLSRQ